jgi:predicted lipase
LNTTLEAKLGEFENAATPILAKLDGSNTSVQISVDEFNSLMSFVSLQAVRTPAFRRTIEQVSAMHAKTVMQAYAQSKDSLRSIMEKAKADRPDEDFPGVSVEEMQKFILDESRYTIQATGDYFFGQQMQLQDDVFQAIVLKKIALLFSESEAFITSDHPVCLVPHPGVPPLYGGFRFSDVSFPISRRVCLFLIAQKHPKVITDKHQTIEVLAVKVSAPQVRETNKVTMRHAENFLFASTSNGKI